MEVVFSKKHLLAWALKALDLDFSFHVSRKASWDELVKIKQTRPASKMLQGEVALDLDEFLKLKSFLTSKNESMDNNKELVFQVTLKAICDRLNGSDRTTEVRQMLRELPPNYEGQQQEAMSLLELSDSDRKELHKEQQEILAKIQKANAEAKAREIKRVVGSASKLTTFTQETKDLVDKKTQLEQLRAQAQQLEQELAESNPPSPQQSSSVTTTSTAASQSGKRPS
jgi:hypothetical protein